MLHSYTLEDGKIVEHRGIKENALWYDLLYLKDEDKKDVEARLKIYIPPQEALGKIGVSDRFYKKNGNLYMTASVVAKAHSAHPSLFPIIFILTHDHLITLRYAEPKPFHTFKHRLKAGEEEWKSALDIFLSILETIVDRVAELTEKISLEIDTISQEVFKTSSGDGKRSKKLNELITRIGQKGDLTAKINESTRSIERLLGFFNFQKLAKETKDGLDQVHILQQDVFSILDHMTFLSHKINFLLDASLGYISIEQNGITKIFTIVAVVFLPPTLVAGIYGMNFKAMPELDWSFGYPLALILIIASAILPFLFFKRKGWL